MKLKLFFLGMFAAALMFSCNNDVITDGPGEDISGTGESTYATFNLNFKKDRAGSYAGIQTVASAHDYEEAVRDAAIYIYAVSGTSTTPEAMAYVSGLDNGSGTDLDNTPTAGPSAGNPIKSVTLKVTAKAPYSDKKIFVALNVGRDLTASPTPAYLLDNNGGAFTYIAYPDTGIDYSTGMPFGTLNNVLYSLPTGITTTTPTAGTAGGSAGLIQTLAGGSFITSSGVLYSTIAGTDSCCLMTNWDGPNDVNQDGTVKLSQCDFQILPNINLTNSKNGTSNYFQIGVQRAYAKVSLRITANGTTVNTNDTYLGPYESDLSDGSKGKFTAWDDGGSPIARPIWSLGGINKSTFPFQQFRGSQRAVASPNYALSTGDTIVTLAPATSDLWYDYYDNTRIFTGKTYGSATVSAVMGTMSTIGNYNVLSPAHGDDQNMVFAMCTENGTEFPQLSDRGTYVVIGGNYSPKNVISDLLQNDVNTSLPPWRGYNGQAAVVGTANQGYDGAQIYPFDGGTYLSYTSGGGMDTLYYYTPNSDFIHGNDMLYKYFAWQLQYAPNDVTPDDSNSAIATAVANAFINGELKAYQEGTCWYRVYVRDQDANKTSSVEDEFLVRRNHIYDVNIVKILGPGIGDPNDIIVPHVPLPVVETFVTVEFTILPWDKVISEEVVTFE